MLFNSYEFIFIFLPIVVAACFLMTQLSLSRFIPHMLIVASLAFYSVWDIRYLPLLLASMTVNFMFGRLIDRSRSRGALICGISFNLLLLGFFKYTNFLADVIGAAADVHFNIPQIVLPLGISFFTFTQIAFLVDAYRGETRKYDFSEYGLFVTIFPHLIAGPILYHKNIIPQFEQLKNFRFSPENVSRGIALFSMGLFKKVAIADNLAPLTSLTFDNFAGSSFVEAWVGAIAYTLQLYFDFSGYSEMAIGLGLLFNIKLPTNFNSPYQATSLIEFWRRWHMSLSDFLKSYLYIPLGGNRSGEFAKMRNLFITMLLCGLWHGAGWTFIVWGALHGALLLVNHAGRKTGIKLPTPLSWAMTFLCVVVAWVIFRAANLRDAIEIIRAMFFGSGVALPAALAGPLGALRQFGVEFGSLKYTQMDMLGVAALTVLVVVMPNPLKIMERFKPTVSWAAAIAFMFLFSLMNFFNITEFLYFQF